MYVAQCNRESRSLQPLAQEAAKLFLSECEKKDLKIFVTEYHRSQARQNYLYEQGRTRPGKVVTWTKKSAHTAGYAWDIACSKPQNLYDEHILNACGQVAKSLGIEWGGDFKVQDNPHFQITSKWKKPYAVSHAYLEAIDFLAQQSLISTKEAWKTPNLKYTPQLIKKLGGLDFLIQKQIIGDTHLWQTNSYLPKHVEALIIKYVHFIKSTLNTTP